ncbi:hypothetical protein HDU91_004665 [Kappamyces sp. JEL0680]|nr:hypothetical protein HDU91_004665 [Kappamyces sp. JEL0680]
MAFKRLLLLGCGAVQQNILAILPQFYPHLDWSQVTILDKLDKTNAVPVREAVKRGARFVQKEVTKSNYATLLSIYVSAGDQVLDLTVGINCQDIVQWCLENGVSYINTALELWADADDENAQQWIVDLQQGREQEGLAMMHSRTLHRRQYDLALAAKAMPHSKATAVIDHGMNPGLVSHFAKAALERIADMVLSATGASDTSATLAILQAARATNDFAKMAQTLGLATIHISEKDSQVPKPAFQRKDGEFLSTWSCDGFFEEGLDPVQVGWGTHEKSLPWGAQLPLVGDSNQIFLPLTGVSLKMKSYVPTFGEIEGYNIPHSEGSTLASYLTVRDEEGQVVYRPTAHYVYHPPQCAIDSWNQVLTAPLGSRESGPTRVLSGRELESGRDAVGVLLLFHQDPVAKLVHGSDNEKPWSYWAGTIVSVEQNLAVSGEYSAPTTVQVAASVLSCVEWIHANPGRGLLWPEALDHNYILEKAAPYLGDMVFAPVQWGNEPEGLQFVDFCVGKDLGR